MFTPVILATAMLTGTPTWRDIVQPNFQDTTFVGEVVSANAAELRKISSDFAVSYRLLGDQVNAEIKEPFMLRVQANIEDTEILYVINGDRRMFKVPRSHISRTENVSAAPGKRETVMDFGFLTPSLFNGLYDAKYIRTDRESGDYVFDLTFNPSSYNDTSRQRIWVDPQKKYLTKRVWFGQDGHEMATFLYQDPQFQNGVWFPTKAVVKNVDEKVAGVTVYKKFKVNSGLSSQPFDF